MDEIANNYPVKGKWGHVSLQILEAGQVYGAPEVHWETEYHPYIVLIELSAITGLEDDEGRLALHDEQRGDIWELATRNPKVSHTNGNIDVLTWQLHTSKGPQITMVGTRLPELH